MGLLSYVLRSDKKIEQNNAEIAEQFEIASCEPDDCSSCNYKYPNMVLETITPLWGSVKPWQHHLLVATGKTDWVHSVTDESGSLAKALDASQDSWKFATKGRVIISNSSLPPPDEHFEWDGTDVKDKPTSLLILPEFLVLNNITPNSASSDLNAVMTALQKQQTQEVSEKLPKSILSSISFPSTSKTSLAPCPDLAYILLCSHRTRDKRCGITAPILQKAFHERLAELDLYRDASDDRPGGVRVSMVSHVGGHKYAANVIIYTKSGQAIWLARIKPEHVEKVLECCVLKGQVFPELLRGAFKTNPVSW